MTFQQLKYVDEIAKCGSINKAAQKLFISQSSISNALKELEAELNISIFERSNQGVTLTESGRQFLSYATPLLKRKEEIESFYTYDSENSKLQFTVSTQHYQNVMEAYVKVIIQTENPNYHFYYREISLDKVILDVHRFIADIGIIIMTNYNERMVRYYLDKWNLEFNPIVHIQPAVFLRKGHPLSNKKILTISDITSYPLVIYESNPKVNIDFSEGTHKLSREKPNKVIEVNGRNAMVNILCNSDAVATGSGLVVESMADPRLMSIPLEDSGENMTLGWIKHKNRILSTQSELFIKLLNESISNTIASQNNTNNID
jgi:DNA-binding transcriptional LysR family regulator